MAARKCAYFSGIADVVVVSRSFSPQLLAMPVLREELDTRALSDEALSEKLDDVFLVIAALSHPAENNRIGVICAEKKILFNNADGETGDVILPSVTRGKNYTIAISTGGTSPAVSRFLREQIERDYPALDAMIGLQEQLRKRLKETEPDQKKRSAILRAVLEDRAVWDTLAKDPVWAIEDIIARYVHG